MHILILGCLCIAISGKSWLAPLMILSYSESASNNV